MSNVQSCNPACRFKCMSDSGSLVVPQKNNLNCSFSFPFPLALNFHRVLILTLLCNQSDMLWNKTEYSMSDRTSILKAKCRWKNFFPNMIPNTCQIQYEPNFVQIKFRVPYFCNCVFQVPCITKYSTSWLPRQHRRGLHLKRVNATSRRNAGVVVQRQAIFSFHKSMLLVAVAQFTYVHLPNLHTDVSWSC